MVKRRRQRKWGGRLAGMLLAAFLGILFVSLLLTLPWRWLTPPTTAFIWRAGHSGLAGAPPCSAVERRWADWENIAAAMPLAVIAAEDQRFPVHWGFDLSAIATALDERITTGRVRGASTVTQQLVKNLYLSPRQSLLRKGLEAWLTLVIEATWSKRRILEMYVNIVQFGDCTFGVEAASRRFFAKPAARLTQAEAALLAASLPNPVRFRVDRPGELMRKKTTWIVEQMRALGGEKMLRRL